MHFESKPIAKLKVSIDDCVEIAVEGCDDLIMEVIKQLINNDIIVDFQTAVLPHTEKDDIKGDT